VIWGEKGWEFYQTNPFFWAKIATFSAIGLISIAPTIAFIRWARAAKADPAFQPQATEVKRMAGLVRIEVLLLLPLAAFAAAMARWAG
jgi:putative membrane protein